VRRDPIAPDRPWTAIVRGERPSSVPL